MKEYTSIEYCHACGENMKITLDLDLSGEHVIECPHCQHEHCREVREGRVTGVRWGSRNGPKICYTNPVYFAQATACATTDSGSYASTSATSYTQELWIGTGGS